MRYSLTVLVSQATGTIKTTWPSVRKTLTQQAYIGVLLGGGLSGSCGHLLLLHMVMPVKQELADICVFNAVGGFIRVFITDGSFVNSCAISLSLFMIVMASVLTGTMLPFGLAKAGIDPANAGTSVQVWLLQVLQCFSLSVHVVGNSYDWTLTSSTTFAVYDFRF